MALNAYKVLGQVTSSEKKVLTVASYALTSNVATITTGKAHNMKIGDVVYIYGVANTNFNGTYVVRDVPTATTFTFNKTLANVSTTTATQGIAVVTTTDEGENLSNIVRSGGLVTLTTSDSHTIDANADKLYVTTGSQVTVDGIYDIDNVPSASAVTYIAHGSDIASAGITGALGVIKPKNIYTVPSAKEAVISTLNIANTLATTSTVNLYCVESGDSVGNDNKIFDSIVVSPNETVSITMGYALSAGDSIKALCTGPGVVFTAFGTELS